MDQGFTVQLGATYVCRKADGTYHEVEVLEMRKNKRSKREEYMVRYVSTGPRQSVWVDKSRLMPIKTEEEEEEVMEVGSELEESESDQTLEYIRTDEDEPEIQEAKVEENRHAANTSMPSSTDFAKELTCLLCSKLYEDPVMVECGHNFCRRCVDKAWTDTFTCPNCKEVLTEKLYTPDRALAKLLKKTAGAPDVRATITPVQDQMPKPANSCLEHEEKLKFFCKDDGALCCLICRDSLKHTGHTFLPIMEAAGVCWAQLTGLINPLEEAKAKTDEYAAQYRERIEQHKPNMAKRRQDLVADFEKLNNFVKEQKEKLLQKFHEQHHSILEEIKTNTINVEETRDFLKEANQIANDTNPLSFLTVIKQFLERAKEKQIPILPSEKPLNEEELCRATFKGPIQYIVWKQMKSIIGPIPEDEEPPLPPQIKEEEETEEPEASAFEQNWESEESEVEEEEEGVAAQVPDSAGEKIWILGNSYVRLAHQHARESSYGKNLKFERRHWIVHWISNTKQFTELFKKIGKARRELGTPAAVFLHLGSYDLENQRFNKLLEHAKVVLYHLLRMCPKTKLVWSAILPEVQWENTIFEGRRKAFNYAIALFAKEHCIEVVTHDELEKNLKARFTKKCCKDLLSSSEMHMFVKNIRNSVLKVMVDRGPRQRQDTVQPATDGNDEQENNEGTEQTKLPLDDFSDDVMLLNEWGV